MRSLFSFYHSKYIHPQINDNGIELLTCHLFSWQVASLSTKSNDKTISAAFGSRDSCLSGFAEGNGLGWDAFYIESDMVGG